MSIGGLPLERPHYLRSNCLSGMSGPCVHGTFDRGQEGTQSWGGGSLISESRRVTQDLRYIGSVL